MGCPQKIRLWGGPSINGSIPLSQVSPAMIHINPADLTSSHRFDVPSDCSVELSPLGYQFFTDVFEVFDKVLSFLSVARGRAHKWLSGQRWCFE